MKRLLGSNLSQYYIPANFFWHMRVRFLSWECWDFWRRHDHFRRFPKKSEVFRRRPKSAKGEVIEKTLIHKIRDREEGIVIYSFYTWFSFLTWVWVNIFLEIVSSKTATTHIFSIRREKLAHKHEPAWDRSFQLAGVRVGRYSIIIIISIIISLILVHVSTHRSLKCFCHLHSLPE